MWRTTDYKGNEQVWYSEDEVKKYKFCLAEIKELVENYHFQYYFPDFKNRIIREINEVEK